MNRRLQLLNDSQVKSFTEEAVVCDVCKLPVVLQGDGNYNLVKWHEHKLSCIPPPPPPTPFPSTSTISSTPKPASNADTEATLVGTSLSPRGKKRQREDEDVTEDTAGTTAEGLDTRPTAKRRTVSYEPPQGFLPSLWKWATTEVKAFVRAAFGGGEEAKGDAAPDSTAVAKA